MEDSQRRSVRMGQHELECPCDGRLGACPALFREHELRGVRGWHHAQVRVTVLVVWACEVVHKIDRALGILFVLCGLHTVGEMRLCLLAHKGYGGAPREYVGQDCGGGKRVGGGGYVVHTLIVVDHAARVKSNNLHS